MKKLDNYKGIFITIEELERVYKLSSYQDLYLKIKELQDENKLTPVKNSGGNGKKPTLYKKYRIVKEIQDVEDLTEEITYKLSTKFKLDYYRKHMEKYKEDRLYVLMLNDFFLNKEELLHTRVSMNERSFQIWGREKFIKEERGKIIVKNLGLDLEDLNFYDTSEPLAYFSISKKVPQNILILENKDTYYTMRNHLIAGNSTILGMEISTIIYGKGKNGVKAFNDFEISVEEYVSNFKNKLFYFGDLDFEGIIIYESLFKQFGEKYNLAVFTEGYEKMVNKCEGRSLPRTKEGQNRNIGDIFMGEFPINYREKFFSILNEGLYIPQEAIDITDL